MKNEEALEPAHIAGSLPEGGKGARVPFRDAVNQPRLLTIPTSNCQGEEIRRFQNYKQAVTPKLLKMASNTCMSLLRRDRARRHVAALGTTTAASFRCCSISSCGLQAVKYTYIIDVCEDAVVEVERS